jgi:ferritin
MLPQPVQNAINQQINNELMASYAYLAMSAHCQSANFVGAANWLRLQSQEEYGHAMRLFDFMLAKDARPQLTGLGEPKGKFKSLLDVFETAFKQEQGVSKQINALYELAFKEKAFDTAVQMQWFVNEQVEEEKSMREIVAKLRMVGDDAPSLLEIDRELGGRGPEAGPAAE